MPAVAAWFHCSVKPISRSTGRSVVAAAAYRLGARLEDHEYGELRDFTRRSGVVASFTLAPQHAPEWARDPELLWNAAEAAENRRNSQLARECELALPASLSVVEREMIARTLTQDLVDRYGVAVSTAVHAPSRRGDDRNHHAHILMTTREVTADGLGKKTRILDAKATGPGEVRWMREHVAGLINTALEKAGVDERIDHRSFQDRGVTREPTTHLGPTASAMEREGKGSDRGDANRETEERNRQFDELVQDLAELDAAIAEERERELDARYGSAEDSPALAASDPAAAEAQMREATAQLATVELDLDTPMAEAQVRDAAAQFTIVELDFGTSGPSATAALPSTETLPRFDAAPDAAVATAQVRAVANPFVEAIRQWDVLPEILVNLVETGVGWWRHAADHLAELVEDVRDAVLTWRDHTRFEREERNRDDGLDFE
jgi:hypothetical protein